MEKELDSEESVSESENNVENTFRVSRYINLISLKKKEEGNLNIPDLVNERVEKANPPIPEPLKQMIRDDYEAIRAVTSNEKVLKAAIEISFNRIICGFERRLTDHRVIPNEKYARLNALEKVDKMFSQEGDPTSEDFQKIALATFDLNGLKPVNDYNKHDTNSGDMYLAMAVDAITSAEVVDYAKKHEINFESNRVTRDGGDEFSVVITSETPFSKEVLQGFVETVQAALWNNNDSAKILDFNDPEVLAYHAGVDVSEVGTKPDEINDFKIKHGIPVDFKYHGAMSGGAVTLFDAITDENFDPKNAITSTDSFPRGAQKLVGAMFSSASAIMDNDKLRFKGGLAVATAESVLKEYEAVGREISPEDAEKVAANRRFMAEVYSRTDKEKELNRENALLRKKVLEQAEKEKLIEVQLSLINETMNKAIETQNWELVKNAQEAIKKILEKK